MGIVFTAGVLLMVVQLMNRESSCYLKPCDLKFVFQQWPPMDLLKIQESTGQISFQISAQ